MAHHRKTVQRNLSLGNSSACIKGSTVECFAKPLSYARHVPTASQLPSHSDLTKAWIIYHLSPVPESQILLTCEADINNSITPDSIPKSLISDVALRQQTCSTRTSRSCLALPTQSRLAPISHHTPQDVPHHIPDHTETLAMTAVDLVINLSPP